MTVGLGVALGVALASHIATAIEPPDDPGFADQWALEQPGDADIDLLDAWAFTTGSPQIVIAVLDTGLDAAHGDFADTERLVPGHDFVNGDDDPADDHHHGTWMAGIIAAGADDGVGIAGVCPGCSIMPVKVLDAVNQGDPDCTWWAQGITFAVDQGADVINLSAGTPHDCPALREAVAYATAREIPIVAAMRNDDTDLPFYPAAYPETIAVGATDRLDRRWVEVTDRIGSNRGAWIDLVAPGEAIVAPRIHSLDELTAGSGTSQAAALVSGSIGLLLSLEPTLGVEALRTILRDSAEDRVGLPDEDLPGFDAQHGAGRLNVAQAVRILAAPDDVDADGHDATRDCDDRNVRVHPGATELPGNGLDDDCDPATSDALPPVPEDVGGDVGSDVLEPGPDARPGGGDGCAVLTPRTQARQPLAPAASLLGLGLLVALVGRRAHATRKTRES